MCVCIRQERRRRDNEGDEKDAYFKALPVFVLRLPTGSGRTSLLGPKLHLHRPERKRERKGKTNPLSQNILF